MANAEVKLHFRMLEGLRHYCAADKSDPFAYARGIAHIKSGITSVGDGKRQYYDAEPYQTTRVIKHGDVDVVVPVIAYRDMVRP